MPVARQSRIWPSGGAHLWAPGTGSDDHGHERGHLVYPASGVLSVHTARGTLVVPANRVAWIPAGSRHHHRAHGVTDMRIVFLAPPSARLLPEGPVVLRVSGLARELILALTRTSQAGTRSAAPREDQEQDGTPERARPAARDDVARASPEDVPPGTRERDPASTGRLHRVLADELRAAPEQPLHLPEPVDDRLRAIARILDEDPSDTSTLAELGRRVGAGARTVSRLLHDELGMTFYEWRTQLRVCHALVLLAEGHDTTRVAHACGWSNPSHFIAAFAAIVGTTPGRHRGPSNG